MATKTLKIGDKVSWNSSQGKVTGSVNKKLVAPTDIKTHHVAASPDDPQWLVKKRQYGPSGRAQTGSTEAGEGQMSTENAHKAIWLRAVVGGGNVNSRF